MVARPRPLQSPVFTMRGAPSRRHARSTTFGGRHHNPPSHPMPAHIGPFCSICGSVSTWRTGGWLPRAGRRGTAGREPPHRPERIAVERAVITSRQVGVGTAHVHSAVEGVQERTAAPRIGQARSYTWSSRETPGPAEGRSPLPDLRLSSAGLDVSISIGPRDPTPTNRGRCRCRVVPVRSPRRTSTGSGPRSPVPAIPSARLELKSGGITRGGGSVSEG